MKVNIEMPEKIIDFLYEKEYNRNERRYLFVSYLMTIIMSSTVDFQKNMEEWLDELTEEELNIIKHGHEL